MLISYLCVIGYDLKTPDVITGQHHYNTIFGVHRIIETEPVIGETMF